MTDVADRNSGESDSEGAGAEGDAADAGGGAADPRDESSREGETDEPEEEGANEAGEAGETADEDGDAVDELIARVAAVDEEAAAEVERLRERVADLEADLADREETIEAVESKLTRARADFQNYKKRAKEREEEIRERATEDLVGRLLDVRDNLVRAVEQDDDVEVREGVEATLATFDRVLDVENVSAIEPEVGDDVDPERHEVVHRTESDEPEGAIHQVYRPGYEMAGKVLRPAQVTVSEGSSTAADDPDAGDQDSASEG